MTTYKTSLNKCIIAVPESRQLDVMAQLLQNRGADVLRVPMVAIYDAPDSEKVLLWLRAFIANPPTLLIIFTGEGLRRLLALAERNALKEAFLESLAQVKKLCRGPKPVRVLREVGLVCEIPSLAPTTDGVIETLKTLSIEGQRVGVQLYGEVPNLKLMEYLSLRQAEVEKVAPYIYADKVDEGRIVELISAMEEQSIGVIAFTSQPQFTRLLQVAKRHDGEKALVSALAKVKVAVVGPLVKEQLEAAGVRVDIMPKKAFFMKPLVTEIMKDFSEGAKISL